jgi:hypothetical protein
VLLLLGVTNIDVFEREPLPALWALFACFLPARWAMRVDARGGAALRRNAAAASLRKPALRIRQSTPGPSLSGSLLFLVLGCVFLFAQELAMILEAGVQGLEGIVEEKLVVFGLARIGVAGAR